MTAMPSPYLHWVDQCPSCNWMLDPSGSCSYCEGGVAMRALSDRSEMIAPAICFVCETSPQGEVVDTLTDFVPGFPSHMAGRKYVCRGCVEALGEQVGLVSREKESAAQRAAHVAHVQLNAVLDKVREFAAGVVSGDLEEVAARAFVEPQEVEVVEPDLVAAQEVVKDPEPVEENAVEKPAAEVEKPKRSRKADADS